MTKTTWRSIAGFVALGLAAALVTDTSPGRAIHNDQRPVVVATLPCEKSRQATSSGFLIDDKTVVTVAHAIFESRDVAVRDVSGLWHRASIQHLDLARDLAVLRVDRLRATPMGPGEVTAGDQVRMLGGAGSGTADGSVIGPRAITTTALGSDEKAVRAGYELALEVDLGDSGAAIVDERGGLVAVVFSRSTRRDGVTWSTSADEVYSILGRTEVPTWACRPGFSPELVLKPPEQERPAG